MSWRTSSWTTRFSSTFVVRNDWITKVVGKHIIRKLYFVDLMVSLSLRQSCAMIFAIAGFVFVATYRENKVKPPTCPRKHTYKEAELLHDATTMPTMFGKIDPRRKYAVFSTTSARNAVSLNFIFLLPLTALAWKRIGYHSIIVIIGSEDVWKCDQLLHLVLNSVLRLEAVVIFLKAHPTNSVMLSQVRNHNSSMIQWLSRASAEHLTNIRKATVI